MPLLLKLKLHQPILLLQRLSDGISQPGTNQDLQPHLETFFNSMLRVSSDQASKELSTLRLPQPPTLAPMQTKQLLMTKIAQQTETQHGTPSPLQEQPSQKMLWLPLTQDMPNTEIDK